MVAIAVDIEQQAGWSIHAYGFEFAATYVDVGISYGHDCRTSTRLCM